MASFSWLRGIKGKLFLSACLPLFGFAAVMYVSYTSQSTASKMLDESYSDVIPNVTSLGNLEGGRARIGQYLWGTVANFNAPKQRETYLKKAETAIEEYKAAVKEYEATPDQPGEPQLYAPMKEHYADYVARVEDMIKTLHTPTAENYEKVRGLMSEGTYNAESVEIKTTTSKIMGIYKQLAIDNNKKQKAETEKSLFLLFAIGAAAGFGVFAMLMLIASRLSKTVGGIVNNLTDAGSQVNLAISQLSQAGQSLSQSSTSAAASLEETVASLEEMSSMVNMNSDNAKQAAGLSQASRTAAEEGEREIKNLVASMQDISQSSKKIEEIINVIDDIAFQTNLLALNASVEAARAGDHGKGFAVVAEAVRSLAQRSAVAAKDITSLIKDSVEKIENGTKIADRSGDVLNNIVTSIKKVSDLNNEIAAASSEQTTGIQQISKAMNQLDQSSQTNAASSEEIASTAEEIASQSTQMQNLVVNLNGYVAGEKTPEATVSEVKPAPAAKWSAKPSAKGQPQPTAKKAANKVLKFTPPAKKTVASSSAEMIPFDDDERKVGTTDGF
ncbi:methyl-accepting chemotaxis protein [Bdellovibrio sp. NC01]|uniref:HAMP domain-containing methyl-accepting chemotaxis protein n=1 Tax=Bdellovibrio sp. NC01 TaxID=2220073 RepID=UPI001157AD57|nr:methyl-accepting chemotaxis protein [Bdellovibrio sp. NC01]QDK37575.1 chemotaxis protein [Bdellovibrio sp. NC01]